MAAAQACSPWTSLPIATVNSRSFLPATMDALNRVLPPTWSHANPVDIIGDAPPERYAAAVKAAGDDPNVDAIIVLNCPTGLASPVEAAEAVARLTQQGRINGKPVLACWLGEHTAREGRQILHRAGVASFETPAEASLALSWLGDWGKAQRALSRVPSSLATDGAIDRNEVLAIFRKVAAEGRSMLTEPEAKAAISTYGIETPQTLVARTPQEAEALAAGLLSDGGKVVVKLLSKAISHKSDVGGVVLNIETAKAAGEAAEANRRTGARTRAACRYRRLRGAADGGAQALHMS